MIHVITPPFTIEVGNLPTLFLAGPIQSAIEWQDSAIEYLLKFSYLKDFIIANPRREISIEGDFDKELYEEQVDWEHTWLSNARRFGSATLFWLSAQKTENKSRTYAQTTRFELGEAMVDHMVYNSNIALGIESGFTGERYIRYTFSKKAQDIEIQDTLKNTCEKALSLLDIWK